MFVTDAVVLTELASMLKLAGGSTQLTTQGPYWATIVANQHIRAYNDLVAILLGRGYQGSDVLTWGLGAMGQAYETQLALFYSITLAGGLKGWTQDQVKILDVRESLQTIALADVNGNFLLPTGDPGSVDYGEIESHNIHYPHGRLSEPREDSREGWWGP